MHSVCEKQPGAKELCYGVGSTMNLLCHNDFNRDTATVKSEVPQHLFLLEQFDRIELKSILASSGEDAQQHIFGDLCSHPITLAQIQM